MWEGEGCNFVESFKEERSGRGTKRLKEGRPGDKAIVTKKQISHNEALMGA